jgi:hypothetical protein
MVRQMIKAFFSIVLLLLLALKTTKAQQPDWEAVLDNAKKSIIFLDASSVNIKNGNFNGVTGTGFIVSNDGYIVTAAHVLRNWAAQGDDIPREKKAEQLIGRIGSIYSPQKYLLELVSPAPHQLRSFIADGFNDFAILRIRGGGDFVPTTFCGVRLLKPGTEVLAVGFPAGYEFNHAPGSISNDSGPGGIWTLNAPIDIGMSGGPLYNKKGQVVGILKGGAEREVNVVQGGVTTLATTDIPIAPIKYATQLLKARLYLDSLDIKVRSCDELEIRKEVTNEELSKLSDPKGQDAKFWQKVADLSSRLKVPHGILIRFFESAGASGVSQENILDQLAKHVEAYKEIGELYGLDNEEVETQALRNKIQDAFKLGDYSAVDALLETAEKVESKAAEKAETLKKNKQLSAAAQIAERGRVASIQRRFIAAANHYQTARSRVPEGYSEQFKEYRNLEAQALLTHGELTGEEEAVTRVIALYKDTIDSTPSAAPLEKAVAHDKMGTALLLLAHGQESGRKSAVLKKAAASFRAALAVITPEQAPLIWAQVQYRLGSALRALAEPTGDAKLLRQAVDAFRASLKITSPEKNSKEWAHFQNGLCYALAHLGRQQRNRELLFQAVNACQDGLKEVNRDKAQDRWGALQDSFGTALWYLGEYEGGTDRLKQARDVFTAAVSALSSTNNVRGIRIVNEHLANVDRLIQQRTKSSRR